MRVLLLTAVLGVAAGVAAVEVVDRLGYLKPSAEPARTAVIVPVPPPTTAATARLAGRPDGRDPAKLMAWADERVAAGDFKTALEAYVEALTAKPDDLGILMRSAQARMLLKDYPGAIADTEAALVTKPTDVGFLYTRGSARTMLGQLEGALSDFSAAIVQMPQHGAFYVARASVLDRMSRPQEAAQDRKRAEQLK